MKLHNKKTGEIFDAIIREKGGGDKYSIIVCNIKKYGQPPITRCILGEYDSLAELNEDWEDYEPKGPLIKDENDPERAEKIRKAIRTWAEVLHIDCDNIKVSIGSHRTSIIGWQPGLIGGYSIDFPNILKELHDGMQTTITELCGDEE